MAHLVEHQLVDPVMKVQTLAREGNNYTIIKHFVPVYFLNWNWNWNDCNWHINFNSFFFNSCPCQDLNPRPTRYLAEKLSFEPSRLGSVLVMLMLVTVIYIRFTQSQSFTSFYTLPNLRRLFFSLLLMPPVGFWSFLSYVANSIWKMLIYTLN